MSLHPPAVSLAGTQAYDIAPHTARRGDRRRWLLLTECRRRSWV